MAARCPICLGTVFRPVLSGPFGFWQTDAAGTPVWTERDRTLLACTTCGHGMVAPEDAGAELLATLYSQPQGAECWAHDGSTPYGEMVEFCRSTLPTEDGALVVDFGCGRGELIAALTAHGTAARLIGVDQSNLLPRPETPFIQADLATLGTEGAVPDLTDIRFAFATHVLEHLPDPRAFLCAVRRRMAPGGGFYVEVPDHGTWQEADALDCNLYTPQHLHFFTLEALTALAGSCGWRVEKADASTFGFTPRARVLLSATPTDQPARNILRFDTAVTSTMAHVAETIGKTLVRYGRIGIWGLGSDWLAILKQNPDLQAAVGTGQVLLFDTLLAGRTFQNISVQDPAALPDQGDLPVILTPRTRRAREGMRRAAAQWPTVTLVDPYEMSSQQGPAS